MRRQLKQRRAPTFPFAGCSRALVLTTPQQVSSGEAIRDSLDSGLFAGLYTNATMHTPEEVTADALKYAEQVKADCVVSSGPTYIPSLSNRS